MFKYKITRGDILVIIITLLLAVVCIPLLLIASKDTGKYFEISYFSSDNVHYETYRLDVDNSYTVSNNGYTLTVKVENSTVYVENSTCEDQICVHTNPITKPGTSIICAPAGIEIKIISDNKGDSDADGVAG